MAARLSALNPSYSPCASSLRHSRRNPRVSAILAAPSLDTPPHKNIALVHKQAPVPAAPATTTTTCQAPSLARLWREIQGAGDWEGLVEPLHPLLRSEIVRYGEFVLACYKTFDLDPASKRYLNCKHGKRSMLREVGLADFGYDVTKYIYATPDIAIPTAQLPGATSSCSRWIGYVAVASDEMSKIIGRRDIVVSFRGTVTRAEWIANFMSALTEAKLDPHGQRPGVKVESGFLSLYTSDDSSSRFSGGSCREQLLAELARLLNQYKDEQVSITLAGHSMGSALALLSGYDLAELGLNRDARGRRVPVTVYSFGGPRVGNAGFKARCEELGVKVLRVVNVNDPVTKLPGVIFNEGFRELAERFELPGACACYAHVGVKLAVDFFKVENPGCVHDLDAYVGLLRSPKMAKEAKESGVDFLSKAAEMLRRSKVVVDQAWRWQDAALHVGNLMLSLNI